MNTPTTIEEIVSVLAEAVLNRQGLRELAEDVGSSVPFYEWDDDDQRIPVESLSPFQQKRKHLLETLVVELRKAEDAAPNPEV